MDEEASISQLVRDDNFIFGTTSVQNISEDTTKIGVWRLELAPNGDLITGSIANVLLAEG